MLARFNSKAVKVSYRPSCVHVAIMCATLALASCAVSSEEEHIGDDTVYVSHERYAQLYRETIADFPHPLPEGVTFPPEPPYEPNLTGEGNGPGTAYLYWECAWEHVYLESDSETDRAEAMTHMRSLHYTEWGSQYIEDPDGIWDATLDKAELGDLTELRSFYDGGCVFYREANGIPHSDAALEMM